MIAENGSVGISYDPFFIGKNNHIRHKENQLMNDEKDQAKQNPSQFTEGQKPASTLVTAVPLTAVPSAPKNGNK